MSRGSQGKIEVKAGDVAQLFGLGGCCHARIAVGARVTVWSERVA